MKDALDVLKKFSEDIADRIVRKTVSELKKNSDTLSGDDSGLKNAWEEICAQIQVESSYFWEAYEGIAWSIISCHTAKLKHHELLAIWFQTDEGEDWNLSSVISRESFDAMSAPDKARVRDQNSRIEGDLPPLCMENIERYIQMRLYEKAENYHNKRIKRFIESH